MQISIHEHEILRSFFSARPIKRAYLFGSSARGEAGIESDLDILVELDHSQPIGMKFFGFQDELQHVLKRKVDLVSTGALSQHIKSFVDADKILIYEGSNL